MYRAGCVFGCRRAAETDEPDDVFENADAYAEQTQATLMQSTMNMVNTIVGAGELPDPSN